MWIHPNVRGLAIPPESGGSIVYLRQLQCNPQLGFLTAIKIPFFNHHPLGVLEGAPGAKCSWEGPPPRAGSAPLTLWFEFNQVVDFPPILPIYVGNRFLPATLQGFLGIIELALI